MSELTVGLQRSVQRIRQLGGLPALTNKIVGIFVRNGFRSGVGYVSRNTIIMIKIVFGHGTYARWIRLYDTPDTSSLLNMRRKVDSWQHHPLISIVMPTYNSDPNFLSAAIDSVQNQIYQNWELCIADDASTNSKAIEVLRSYQKKDPRIKIAFRKENGHISIASNTALELATGEWIALLDHDDLLAPTALFWVVEAINSHPDISLLYSDEDKVDVSGKRHAPFFKPDWNKALLYSQNYFCHLGVYKKQLIDEIGGFRPGFEGAQDYDLVLRCVEKLKSNQIFHIPKILYHWRSHDLSTAKDIGAKDYAVAAGQKALSQHLGRIGVQGQVAVTPFGYRVKYDLPIPEPLVSLIISTKNAHELVKQCIESIQSKTKYKNYEIILVDNQSDNPRSIEYFKKLEDEGTVRLLHYQKAFNYSAINNFACEHAKGGIVGLINNDIEVISPDWLGEMVSLLSQKGVGAVGAKLLYPNNKVQHAGVIFGVGGVAGHSSKYADREESGYFCRAQLISEFSAVTGACLLTHKDAYFGVGGLNEKDLSVAFNDVDYCLKLIKAGYQIVWTPYAELYHHESATRGDDYSLEKRARFDAEVNYMMRSWPQELGNDPAYNPNLTVESEDYALAFPPRVGSFNESVHTQ
jgi:glycosyltransferase involved in cell wall biosynthesis